MWLGRLYPQGLLVWDPERLEEKMMWRHRKQGCPKAGVQGPGPLMTLPPAPRPQVQRATALGRLAASWVCSLGSEATSLQMDLCPGPDLRAGQRAARELRDQDPSLGRPDLGSRPVLPGPSASTSVQGADSHIAINSACPEREKGWPRVWSRAHAIPAVPTLCLASLQPHGGRWRRC